MQMHVRAHGVPASAFLNGSAASIKWRAGSAGTWAVLWNWRYSFTELHGRLVQVYSRSVQRAAYHMRSSILELGAAQYKWEAVPVARAVVRARVRVHQPGTSIPNLSTGQRVAVAYDTALQY
eukprot:512219-Rhodomonas_salina.1